MGERRRKFPTRSLPSLGPIAARRSDSLRRPRCRAAGVVAVDPLLRLCPVRQGAVQCRHRVSGMRHSPTRRHHGHVQEFSSPIGQATSRAKVMERLSTSLSAHQNETAVYEKFLCLSPMGVMRAQRFKCKRISSCGSGDASYQRFFESNIKGHVYDEPSGYRICSPMLRDRTGKLFHTSPSPELGSIPLAPISHNRLRRYAAAAEYAAPGR